MNDAQSIRIGRADARPDCTDNSTTLRFLLYSHDSHGLGHLRRNLTIAKALLDRFHNASVMILTGYGDMGSAIDALRLGADETGREGELVAVQRHVHADVVAVEPWTPSRAVSAELAALARPGSTVLLSPGCVDPFHPTVVRGFSK